MMGGDDDDGDTIVETQEISSENLFHLAPRPLRSGHPGRRRSGRLVRGEQRHPGAGQTGSAEPRGGRHLAREGHRPEERLPTPQSRSEDGLCDYILRARNFYCWDTT